MARTLPENKLRERVIATFDVMNAECRVVSDRYKKGLPDLSIVYMGRAVFVETKDKGKRPEPLQDEWLRKYARVHAICAWVQNHPQGPKPWQARFQLMSPNGIWLGWNSINCDRWLDYVLIPRV